MENYKLYINGEFVDSSSKKTFESIDPSTEKPWATIAEANEEDVNFAVEAANTAFHAEWSSILPTQRAKFLRAIGDQLKKNAELLGSIETRDTGKILKETKFQANYIAEFYNYYAGLADKIEGSTLPIDKQNMQVFTTREPIGVIAAIIPWNSQQFLTAVKLAPALAMGNTIIIKASESAPTPLLELAKLIDKVGLPKGVVNIITGFPDKCSKILTSHKKIDRIAFTGGMNTAKHIVENSAKNLSQVTLELGGKSPVAVFNDANIENALNGVTASIFGASGQSCIAGSRLYIQEKIYDEFLTKIIKKTQKIIIGSPMNEETQMGPLATLQQLKNIEEKISQTIEQGGKLLIGGERPKEFDKGFYFKPTIIECKNHNLPAAEEELFGIEPSQNASASGVSIGAIESAHNGTLVLDEVSDLPVEIQGKLVRVLQEQVFQRIGGTSSVEVDVRVLATNSRNLQKEIADASSIYNEKLENKERFVVGVNNFVKVDEKVDIPILEITNMVQKKQISEIQKIKQRRNQNKVEIALNDITTACKTNKNLLPLIINAALEYATLGEIVDSMKKVFGEWTEQSII